MSKLKVFNSNFGNLAVIDKNITRFPIKRVYFIYDVKSNLIRGHHAHIATNQVLICLKGKIQINLDDGTKLKSEVLSSPSTYILVKKMFWHTMEWLEEDSILLVLADKDYNEKDYIRSYENFSNIIKKRNLK
jgi:dTDP-4-dehydrorhamnose 3,5-epimerase-like enzyme